MTASTRRSGEFGLQLRQWRRRRSLSQFELAAQAGTTPRHLSFLETGRSRPRTDMVLRLGEGLGLPPREQNAMLEAAGLPAVFPDHALDDGEMARFRDVVDSLLDRHEPLPAAVLDRYGVVRRANRAFGRLMPGLVGLEPEDLVERFFAPGPWRDALPDWTGMAAAWLARQRLELRRTGDPRLEALVARAETLVGPLPPAAPAELPPVACARIRIGDEVLEFFAAVVRFDAASDVTLSELRVELMYPANAAADRFFRSTATRT